MKRVMIIGVGAGFGLALARQFGRTGAEVVMVARNALKLQDYQAQLAAEGITATWQAVDATDFVQLAQLFKDENDIDTLIYNVGIMTPDDPIHTDPHDMEARLRANVTSAVAACQSFLASVQPETILITGGGAALHPSPLTTSLAMSKAALRSYTLALHTAAAAQGVYVGLMTIQGIANVGPDMAPDKVAAAYVKAAQQRSAAEIFYPGGAPSPVSEFDQLKQLAADPQQRAALLAAHPEFAKYQKYLE